MKKYNDLLQITELQHTIDSRYGKGRYKAFYIMLLFMCLTFSSCANDKTPAQEQAERQQQEQRNQQNPRTAGTRITISNTGQIRELEVEPFDPNDDGVQRIRRAYFAKKIVTKNGTRVDFEQINDSILGKTVYLVLETNNMARLNIDVVIKPANDTLTGDTETLELMRFNPEARQAPYYQATTMFTTQVGNFDMLNNNQRTHNYTNLGTNANMNRAVIKLQLRPGTRAVFNTWVQNLGTGTANLEIIAERTDNMLCAYGDSDEEIGGAGTFLNEESGENQRFGISNKNFYEIYHGNNTCNFLPIRTGIIRKRMGMIENNQTNNIIYFYYDRYDNEHKICEVTKFTTTGKRKQPDPGVNSRGQLLETIDFTDNVNAEEQIYAQRLEIYERGTLGIASRFGRNSGFGTIWYANQRDNVNLINADILQEGGVGPQTFRALNYISPDNSFTITFGFKNTRRRSANPTFYAAFLGSLAQLNYTSNTIYIESAGFSFEDASCYPSASHVNGMAIDTSYLNSLANQNIFVNCMRDYGIMGQGRGNLGWQPQINHSTFLTGHNDHLHSYQFNNNFIHTII